MKKLLFAIAAALLVSGCGGGDTPESDAFNFAKLVENKTFYSVDECSDPQYYTISFIDGHLDYISYNDSDFTEQIDMHSYPLTQFSEDNIAISRDGVESICDSSYTYDKNSEDPISDLMLHCHNDDDPDAVELLFTNGYPNMEEAKENKNSNCNIY